MFYLEARCVSLARAIGAQGVQNGGIDGAAVAGSVPGGVRSLHGREPDGHGCATWSPARATTRS